jgi:hypothetical protein
MKLFKLGVLALVTAFLAACSGEQSPTGPTMGEQNQPQPQNPSGTGQPSDPVASIVISPAAANANAGSTTQFTATLKNAAGQTLTGRTVVWSTSSSSVVDINSNGLATAKSSGSATVTAAAEGKTASGSFAVMSVPQPPSSGSWANEPSGLSTISNNPLDALNVLGWGTAWNNGTIVPANDPQRGSVLQWNYPVGFTGGKGPGMEYYDHAPAKEVFAGFWWKPSDPWQNHDGSHVNKIAFWYTTTAGQNIDIQMYGTPPYRLDVVVEFPSATRLAPNVTTSAVTLGVWHKIEWHAKYASSAGSGDGLVEWWMDGVLQGRYTNIQTPNDAGYAQYQISPTWGGLDGVKTENDYYRYDDIHLSRR